MEEVKEEEKGESKSNAARGKKTSNLHSDCWAPSMCCDDGVYGRNASCLITVSAVVLVRCGKIV